MFPAPLFLAILIGLTPAIFWFDGPIAHGAVAAAAGFGLALVALTIRRNEAKFTVSLIRPLAFVGALPAIWMLIQVLPLPIVGLGNPIWQSTAQIVDQSMWGSISVDIGATLISLGRYLSAAAIVLLTATVAIDRRQAALILYSLTAATTMIALLLLGSKAMGITVFSKIFTGFSLASVTNCVSLGVILSVAALLRILEVQRTHQFNRYIGDLIPLILCFLGIAASLAAVFLYAQPEATYAAAIGVIVLISVRIVRRIGIGPWGYSAFAAVAFVAVIATLAFHVRFSVQGMSLTLSHAPSASEAITQRILMDAGWTGTGAGTFSAMIPIYRDFSEIAIGIVPPTAAAAIAVELGKLMFWAILTTVIVLIIDLLRSAVRRGRDSTYPSAGAGCLIALIILAFNDAGLFGTAVSTISAAIIGVAFGQRKSLTTLQPRDQ